MKKIPDNQIAFYQSPDGSVNIEVLYAEENIWLTQKKMAELFDTTPQNITQHLKKIYSEREIEESTCKDFLQVQTEGSRDIERTSKMYSLEAIIAVGYRVSSERGTQFRQWATGILKSYIHKGYALDSDRMKYGSRFSARYFEDLYEEIKDIRTSERRIYQKITDIYATAIDYSPKAYESKEFFATVQNGLLYAVTQQTAAEIIVARANPNHAHFGLLAWKGAQVRKQDIIVAKNYLSEDEIDTLNRLVVIFLETAELRAKRQAITSMAFWQENIGQIITANGFPLLAGAGKVSHVRMEEQIAPQYLDYDQRRKTQAAQAADEQDEAELKALENNIKNRVKP